MNVWNWSLTGQTPELSSPAVAQTIKRQISQIWLPKAIKRHQCGPLKVWNETIPKTLKQWTRQMTSHSKNNYNKKHTKYVVFKVIRNKKIMFIVQWLAQSTFWVMNRLKSCHTCLKLPPIYQSLHVWNLLIKKTLIFPLLFFLPLSITKYFAEEWKFTKHTSTYW